VETAFAVAFERGFGEAQGMKVRSIEGGPGPAPEDAEAANAIAASSAFIWMSR